MDAKTRKILIIVCVVAFLLTSAFTWGVISAGIDLAQHTRELGGGPESWAVRSDHWTLALANVLEQRLILVNEGVARRIGLRREPLSEQAIRVDVKTRLPLFPRIGTRRPCESLAITLI